MTVEDAVRIVTSFGGIAEISAITGADMAAPSSMLPYPKETIEIAIETYMDSLIRTRKYSDKARSYLKTGYTMLACFIPDEQVKIVKKGEKALQLSAAKANRDNPAVGGDDDEDWDSVNKSSAVLQTVQEEMSQRQEAIDKFELQQLFDFVGG